MNEKVVKTIQYNNFETFVHQNWNRVFRYWVYRRIYTPYEIDKKFSDESIYEDDYCAYAYIRECIALPNGDYLLGFEDSELISDDNEKYIKYFKLSEIRLEYYSEDSINSEN